MVAVNNVGVTHLRNADTDADMQWNPAAPNHSTMDSYCMSCHDANGATSAGSVAIQALIQANGINATGKTASPSNPFGDTISNRYDKMFRPAVVNVDSQFDVTNNSHHGVKGPRYTGRTRTAGSRQIANPAAFDDNSTATLWGKRSTIYDGVDAVTGVTGGPREAFNALYVPLENAGGETAPRTGAASLGDDSTLHCGDCHTVGQYKPGTANGYTPTDPATLIAGTSVAIGAHGSNNEYLLRNSKATDERHTQDAFTKAANGNVTLTNPNAAFLVCFNCHSYERYGSVFNATGSTGPHAGEYDASGRCNGVFNTIPFNGYTTGTATDGTQFSSRFDGTVASKAGTPAFAAGFPLNFANAPGGVQAATYLGEGNPDFGDIFGIQCLNCHNSGVGNGYGGIHGSANNTVTPLGTPNVAVTGGAYVDGMGNTNKVERFLPGLGNVMYVPGTLGGFTGGTIAGPVTVGNVYTYTTGGISNDTNWEQVMSYQGANSLVTTANALKGGAGCYTLSETATAASFGIEGEPVAGAGSPEVEVFGTWGGCDDHGAAPGKGDHGVVKRINRPVTY
jgi:mono/diheme cytochrome c family protein